MTRRFLLAATVLTVGAAVWLYRALTVAADALDWPDS